MRKDSYIVAYSVFFLIAFIFFPAWLASPTTPGRFLTFGIMLAVWGLVTFIISKFMKDEKPSSEGPKVLWKHKLAFVLVFAILMFVMYPSMSMPIRAKTDEGSHVLMGAALLEQSVFMAEGLTGLPVYMILKVLLWAVIIVLVISLFVNKKRVLELAHKTAKTLSKPWVGGTVIAVAVLWAIAVIQLTKGFSYANINALVSPYPSLGVIYTSTVLLLMGYSEFLIRLPWSLLCVASGVMVYKTVSLFRDKRMALWSAVMFLFFPVYVFFFAHYKPIAPEAFLVITSIYYFAKYQKHKSSSDLWTAMLIAGAGSVFKLGVMSAFIVAVGFAFFSWLFVVFRKKDATIAHMKTYLPPFAVALSFIAIRYVMQALYHPSIWPYDGGYTIHHLTSYVKLLPLQVTWLVSILSIFGLLILLYKRDKFTGIAFSWFAFVYLLYSSHKMIVAPRWTIVLLPVVAIAVAEFFTLIAKGKVFGWKLSGVSWIGFFVVLGVLIAGVDSFVYISNWQNQFLPQNEADQWLAENADPTVGVYRMLIPYYFYERKHGVDNPLVVGKYAGLEEQSLESLHSYAVDNNVGYVMFPVGLAPSQPINNVSVGPYSATYYSSYWTVRPPKSWNINDYTEELIEGLQTPSEYFEPAAEFQNGNSKIFIARVLA